MAKKRVAQIERKTKETDIKLLLNIDGTGKPDISSGIPFFDHMLSLLAQHGLFDLDLKAKGDIKVDVHHTVEDIGICLGQAFKKALGDKKGIERFASASVPMDESLCNVAIDLSNRPHLTYKANIPERKAGEFETEVLKEFFSALVNNAGITLHINLLYSENTHHAIESMFKALAVALSKACQINPRQKGIPSTKGKL